MPWAAVPHREPDRTDEIAIVTDALDPVLVPLDFAPGQVGAHDEAGQVIFCRGMIDSTDEGCVDLVIDLEAQPEWRIVDVRYWGYDSDRWHLQFDRDADLGDQVAGLVRTLPPELERPST